MSTFLVIALKIFILFTRYVFVDITFSLRRSKKTKDQSCPKNDTNLAFVEYFCLISVFWFFVIAVVLDFYGKFYCHTRVIIRLAKSKPGICFFSMPKNCQQQISQPGSVFSWNNSKLRKTETFVVDNSLAYWKDKFVVLT